MSDVLVIKFGGTSLAAPARVRRAALRIRHHVRRGRRVVAVVSAQGHATDDILRQVALAAPAAPVRARRDTTAAGGRAREVDRALATGEDRSAALLAAALWSAGVPAISLRGSEAGVRGDGAFGGGAIRHVAAARLRRVLDTGVVPVVSGFQAVRSDGETVTLGRGGSDTSAVAIAAALAAECHIVTDVDGVYDRDPNLHPDAQRLPRLSHAALVALVERGAQVVHPPAATLALATGVPLRIHHHAARPGTPTGTVVGTVAGGARAGHDTRASAARAAEGGVA